MPAYGGMTPYPRRYGGGTPRVQTILRALNADRGTAYDASTTSTTVYVIDMAIARAIAAAWGTNERLGNAWVASKMPADILRRWETILALYPAPEDTEVARRANVETVFARFGRATNYSRVYDALVASLGASFVALEHIDYSIASITVPDGTYPWGSVGTVPWSSTTAHIMIRMQKPTGWTEIDFSNAVAQIAPALEPILPAWTTWDWYRPGPSFSAISGGPSAAGFYLDDDHNLDNELFDT